MKISFFTADSRLSDRAEYCVRKLSEHPERSFLQIFQKSADLEGFYRLMNNPRLGYEGLISSIGSHCLETLGDREILFIHDTTLIEPESKAKSGKGFARLHGRGQGRKGFLAHVSLAVGLESKPVIHGVAGAFLWTRKGHPKGWESERWWSQIKLIENQRPSYSGKSIHVMDREADIYSIFYHLQDIQTRFVIRLSHNRCIQEGEYKRLHQELESMDTLGEREVFLSKRVTESFFKQGRIHPSRAARKTILCVAAKRIILDGSKIERNRLKEELPESLAVHVVRVFEKNVPKKEKAVEWYLVTNEPIETIEQVWKVVDIYRRRWVIEEFFKALKTGCRLESRLFSTLESWEKLVAFYLPIAGSVFNLKNLTLQPLEFFTPTQWAILQSIAQRDSMPLESMVEAQLLVAHLGGHIKYAGPPRGYHELLSMEAGWNMHRDK